jgi:LysM repeat protein
VDRRQLARVAAPAAFLLAATVAILLVRSALDAGDAPAPIRAPTTTAPGVREARRPATTRAAPTTVPTGTAAAAEYYVIERGDTLASVADQYGTTVEQLLVLNPDVDPVSLTIGQRIRVQ